MECVPFSLSLSISLSLALSLSLFRSLSLSLSLYLSLSLSLSLSASTHLDVCGISGCLVYPLPGLLRLCLRRHRLLLRHRQQPLRVSMCQNMCAFSHVFCVRVRVNMKI